jgi:arylsulfatase A-like enzyme
MKSTALKYLSGMFLILGMTWPLMAADAPAKPNILLIIADDLNNWIGPNKGNPQVKTPNLDKLAARGVTFQNAQASAPLCNPSRASFMSGQRPSTTGIYNNQQPAMPHLPRGVCLNDYVRQFGYTSLGAGKIYHYHQYREADWDKVVFYGDDTLPNHPAKRRPGPFGYRMFTEDKPDAEFNEQRAESALVDARSVSWCIEQLGQQQGAFFMACGVHRPHTPWDVPKKYFDMYPLETVNLPPILTNDLADVPPAGIAFAKPNGVHQAILKAGVWQDRVRAYLAAISYADAQIGRLLDALDKSKYRDNTIIIFVGDNGWHLGEKEHWAKSALWRRATNVPLIWVAPGVTKPGTECNRAVDLTSIFPTVCELAGIPTPKHAEGISIRPLLKNPSGKWTQPAISTFLQNNHAICTEEWRYIRYADGSEELYNQKADPNEWTNQAAKPELAKIKMELAKSIPSVNAQPVPEKPDAGPKGKKGKKARPAAEVDPEKE